jgi:hypothetical protein
VLSSPETTQAGKGASPAQVTPPKPQRSRVSSQELQKLPAFDKSDDSLLEIAALGLRKRFFQAGGYKKYRGGAANSQTTPWAEHVEVAFFEGECYSYHHCCKNLADINHS